MLHMDEPHRHYAKGKKPDMEDYIFVISLIWNVQIRDMYRERKQISGSSAWQRGWELTANGPMVTFVIDRKALKLDCDDGCTIPQIYQKSSNDIPAMHESYRNSPSLKPLKTKFQRSDSKSLNCHHQQLNVGSFSHQAWGKAVCGTFHPLHTSTGSALKLLINIVCWLHLILPMIAISNNHQFH